MMRVIVSIFMVIAFEYERERRKYCPQNARPFGANRSFGFDSVRLLCFRLCLSLFKRTPSQNADAMLVSKSTSGGVPKLGRPNLAQYGKDCRSSCADRHAYASFRSHPPRSLA